MIKIISILLLLFLAQYSVSAHEVYVLNSSEVGFALEAPAPDFISTINEHIGQFITWGLLTIIIILVIFFLSISRPFERFCDPWLDKLKKYAPHIAQITLGLALIASGYYHAIFGVELPLQATFGAFESLVSYGLIIIGIMLTIGLLPRIAAILATALFIGLIIHFKVYMLNYATYLGEALTIALFGGAHTLFASNKMSHILTRVISPILHKYKFLIMRILFGVSLVYASLYAKLIHGALALEVVSKYNLTHYFPFDPVFLVLGSMLIEVLLGICFMIGFEIRFASLFFLIFLTLSLVFFGEAVWPHIILIGTAIAMFTHGYDPYTFSVKLERHKELDPVF